MANDLIGDHTSVRQTYLAPKSTFMSITADRFSFSKNVCQEDCWAAYKPTRVSYFVANDYFL